MWIIQIWTLLISVKKIYPIYSCSVEGSKQIVDYVWNHLSLRLWLAFNRVLTIENREMSTSCLTGTNPIRKNTMVNNNISSIILFEHLDRDTWFWKQIQWVLNYNIKLLSPLIVQFWLNKCKCNKIQSSKAQCTNICKTKSPCIFWLNLIFRWTKILLPIPYYIVGSKPF